MKEIISVPTEQLLHHLPPLRSESICTCANLVSKATTAVNRPILDGIDCTIAEGDFVALVGLNGAGKSSLLRAIAGLMPLKSGNIDWGDRHPKLAMLFQGGALIPQLSALDNILCGNLGRYSVWQMFKGWPMEDTRGAMELLDRFGLADNAHRPVAYLSGGQQQRVAISRALWQSPDILLADEPTTGLDILAAQDVMATLDKLHRAGMTIVAVLHDLHLASTHANKAIVVNHGRVVYQGNAANLVDLFPQLVSEVN
jgi:phosphonate transport system ATP-binding protein